MTLPGCALLFRSASLLALLSLAVGCAGRSMPVTAAVAEGPALPISTASHAGGLVGGMPVVVGGTHWSDDKTTKRWLHECFVYRDGAWVAGPGYPRPVSDTAYAHNRDGLIVAGGSDGSTPSNAVLQLSNVNGQLAWRELPPLPEPIEAASGAILNDKFYVAVGFSGGKASNRLWMLDLRAADRKWTALAPLPARGRGYAALVPVGDNLLLLGGLVLPPYEKDVTIFDDAYRYQPASDQWTEVDGFSLPGYAWTATAVDRDHVMLSGRCPKISQTSSDVLLLDVRTFQSRSIGNLVTPACCMPSIKMGPRTWWLPGGEPDATRSRTARTSVVKLSE